MTVLLSSLLLFGLAQVPTPPDAGSLWPGAGAVLSAPVAHFPKGFRRRRVFIDAGHGAANNTGNRSVFCEDEQDFTLALAADLGRRLEQTGHFTVRQSRRPGHPVPYDERVAAAEAWGADVFVSLHSDARGLAQPWTPDAGQACYRQDATPGFAVLWSDLGPASLVLRRRHLSEALCAQLSLAGFLAYDGVDYPGLYDPEPGWPGSFVDRHVPGRRIYVLRRPRLPSVIVETHHALDYQEALRWKEPRTWEVFSAAVAAALSQAP